MNEMMNKNQKAEAFLLLLVTRRGEADKYGSLLSEHESRVSLVTHGEGTAPSMVLSCLGLSHTDYDVMFGIAKETFANDIMESLREKLKSEGSGIAVTIPLSGSGGDRSRKKIGLTPITEEEHMDNTVSNSGNNLIVVIINQGYSDEVMEVARKAGATGGTVIHARGTGASAGKSFFGMTIQPEKDMILIVSSCASADAIMTAIEQDEGLKTTAHPVSFSLPVEHIAGITANAFEE